MAIKWFNSINGFSVGDQLTEVIDTSGNVFTSKITSYIDVDIVADNGNEIWTFDNTGNVVFPDTTTQTTAYPGTATTLSLTGNISSGNANLGNLTTSNYFHGVFDNTSSSQPNITSVGNLTGLTIGNLTSNVVITNGNLTATGAINANNFNGNFYGNFSGNVDVSGNIKIGGSNTQVLFNSNGDVQGSNAYTFDYTANILTLTGNAYVGNLTASSNVSAQFYYGDGRYLTGIAPTIQQYLFSNVASDISPYYQAIYISDFSTSSPTANSVVTIGTTGTLLAEFLTNANFPGITTISIGQLFVRYETRKASGNKEYTTYGELWKRTSGGTETLLLTSDLSTPTAFNSTIQQAVTMLNTTIITLDLTDRLAVKIYGYTDSGTDSITTTWGGTTDSGIELPTPPASSTQFVPYQNAIANLNLGTKSISAANVLTDHLLYANGTAWDLGGTPAGSNTEIQFNNNNEFGASANLTFDFTSNTLTTYNVVANTSIFYGNITNGKNALQAGVTGFTAVPNTIAQFTSNLNSATQINLQNINTGATSSTDIVVTSDNGNSTNNYINMGITGSSWDGTQTNSLGNALTPDDGYLYVRGGNLVIGTSRTPTAVKFVVGGTGTGNLVATINKTNVDITGDIIASGNANITGNISSTAGLLTLSTGTLAVSGGDAGIFTTAIGNINFGLVANISMGSTTGNVTARGNLTVNDTATITNLKVSDIYSNRTPIAVTANTIIDSFPVNQYRSAKYTMRVNSDDGYQAVEVLLIHDSANSYVTIYGSLSTVGFDIIALSTNILSGNVRMLATTGSANTTVNLLGVYVAD